MAESRVIGDHRDQEAAYLHSTAAWDIVAMSPYGAMV